MVDQEFTAEGQRFGVSQVPGGMDVTLSTGPRAGREFIMGGANAHRARILHACRRFLEGLDRATGRVDHQ